MRKFAKMIGHVTKVKSESSRSATSSLADNRSEQSSFISVESEGNLASLHDESLNTHTNISTSSVSRDDNDAISSENSKTKKRRHSFSLRRRPSNFDSANSRGGVWGVPLIVQRGVEYLYARGLEEMAIFSAEGNKKKVKKALKVFKSADAKSKRYIVFDPDDYDPHDVATAIKCYLKQEITPILAPIKEQLLESTDGASHSERVRATRAAISNLPHQSIALLHFLLCFMNALIGNSEQNHMTEVGLASIFAPILISHELAQDEQLAASESIRFLILYHVAVFDSILPAEYKKSLKEYGGTSGAISEITNTLSASVLSVDSDDDHTHNDIDPTVDGIEVHADGQRQIPNNNSNNSAGTAEGAKNAVLRHGDTVSTISMQSPRTNVGNRNIYEISDSEDETEGDTVSHQLDATPTAGKTQFDRLRIDIQDNTISESIGSSIAGSPLTSVSSAAASPSVTPTTLEGLLRTVEENTEPTVEQPTRDGIEAVPAEDNLEAEEGSNHDVLDEIEIDIITTPEQQNLEVNEVDPLATVLESVASIAPPLPTPPSPSPSPKNHTRSAKEKIANLQPVFNNQAAAVPSASMSDKDLLDSIEQELSNLQTQIAIQDKMFAATIDESKNRRRNEVLAAMPSALPSYQPQDAPQLNLNLSYMAAKRSLMREYVRNKPITDGDDKVLAELTAPDPIVTVTTTTTVKQPARPASPLQSFENRLRLLQDGKNELKIFQQNKERHRKELEELDAQIKKEGKDVIPQGATTPQDPSRKNTTGRRTRANSLTSNNSIVSQMENTGIIKPDTFQQAKEMLTIASQASDADKIRGERNKIVEKHLEQLRQQQQQQQQHGQQAQQVASSYNLQQQQQQQRPRSRSIPKNFFGINKTEMAEKMAERRMLLSSFQQRLKAGLPTPTSEDNLSAPAPMSVSASPAPTPSTTSTSESTSQGAKSIEDQPTLAPRHATISLMKSFERCNQLANNQSQQQQQQQQQTRTVDNSASLLSTPSTMVSMQGTQPRQQPRQRPASAQQLQQQQQPQPQRRPSSAPKTRKPRSRSPSPAGRTTASSLNPVPTSFQEFLQKNQGSTGAKRFTTPPPRNVFDRLYQRAMTTMEMKESWVEAERKKLEMKRNKPEDLTFKPQLNTKTVEIVKKKKEAAVKDTFERLFYIDDEMRRKHHEELMAKFKQAQYSFTPTLGPKTNEIAHEKIRRGERQLNTYEQLFREAKERREYLRSVQELQQKAYSYASSVSSVTSTPPPQKKSKEEKESFLNRLVNSKQLQEKALNEVREQQIRQLTRPLVLSHKGPSKQSEEHRGGIDNNNMHITEKLYIRRNEYREIRDFLRNQENEQSRQMANMSHLHTNSQEVLKELTTKCLKSLFDVLDSDKDGHVYQSDLMKKMSALYKNNNNNNNNNNSSNSNNEDHHNHNSSASYDPIFCIILPVVLNGCPDPDRQLNPLDFDTFQEVLFSKLDSKMLYSITRQVRINEKIKKLSQRENNNNNNQFKPNILSQSIALAAKRRNNLMNSNSNSNSNNNDNRNTNAVNEEMSLVERLYADKQQWDARRQERMRASIEKEMAECTFHPQIITRTSTASSSSSSSSSSSQRAATNVITAAIDSSSSALPSSASSYQLHSTVRGGASASSSSSPPKMRALEEVVVDIDDEDHDNNEDNNNNNRNSNRDGYNAINGNNNNNNSSRNHHFDTSSSSSSLVDSSLLLHQQRQQQKQNKERAGFPRTS